MVHHHRSSRGLSDGGCHLSYENASCISLLCPMINGCQANGEWCKVRLDHLEPSVTRSARWLTPVSWEWAPAGPNGLTVINGPIYMAQQQQTWISEYQAALAYHVQPADSRTATQSLRWAYLATSSAKINQLWQINIFKNHWNLQLTISVFVHLNNL